MNALGVALRERLMSADGMRVYISTLRKGRGLSQDALAESIGMNPRTYLAWETGKIQDIKAPFLLKAVGVLRGSSDHLVRLADDKIGADEGRSLADAALEGFEAGGGLAYIKTPEDVAELMQYFEEELTAIRQEDRRSLGDALRGFLAGFRAGRRRNDN